MSASTDHACALTEDGEAVCWGPDNYLGELDAPPGRYVAISGGETYRCALAEQGEVVCWGRAVPPLRH